VRPGDLGVAQELSALASRRCQHPVADRKLDVVARETPGLAVGVHDLHEALGSAQGGRRREEDLLRA
jgi:hypothetical protein